MSRRNRKPRKSWLSRISWVFGWCCIFLFWLWAVGAVRFHRWLPEEVGLILATLMVVWAIVLAICVERFPIWFCYIAGMATTVWLLSFLQQPSHERDWDENQVRLASIETEEESIVVQNFRSTHYRSETDFDVNYGDISFDMSQLEKVWLIVQRFTQNEGLAHVFLTFEIANPDGASQFMAVSVEIRCEKGETYSPIRGLYRQYELNYVFGSEEDLLGVRTVMRPDDRVYMYPVNATPLQVQRLFANIADRTNEIGKRPEFYHSLLNNCMNGVLEHTYELTPEPISWMNPKVVLPGYSGKLAFEKGLIGDGGDFEEFQQRCRIDKVAKEFGIKPGFSLEVRRNIGSAHIPVVPDYDNETYDDTDFGISGHRVR